MHIDNNCNNYAGILSCCRHFDSTHPTAVIHAPRRRNHYEVRLPYEGCYPLHLHITWARWHGIGPTIHAMSGTAWVAMSQDACPNTRCCYHLGRLHLLLSDNPSMHHPTSGGTNLISYAPSRISSIDGIQTLIRDHYPICEVRLHHHTDREQMSQLELCCDSRYKQN